MFDVFADEITFNRFPIARFVEGAPATVQDEARSWLAGGTPDGFVTDEDNEAAVKEAREESYAEGKEAGIEEGRREEQAEHEEELEEACDRSFAEGRKAGAEAAGKAEDVARLDALLARVALAEAKLRGALNGIREEGKYKPRQLKAAEFKTVVRECFLELQHAKIEFGR